MFYQFLRESNEKVNSFEDITIVNYSPIKWQQFFQKNASFRTICIDCVELIEQHYSKVKQYLRFKENYELTNLTKKRKDKRKEAKIVPEE